MASSYEARIMRVIDHIHDHPADDLSLDAMADLAAMSRFHWHRVFRGVTGETIAQAVRRIRMERAAQRLLRTSDPNALVARQVGYPNLQSFGRVFRDAYGISPAVFRDRGEIRPHPKTHFTGETSMYEIEINDRPSLRLAAMAHQGAYPEIGKAFEKISAVMASRNLWSQLRGMAGVYYDDPSAVAEADLRSHAGVIVADDFGITEPLEEVKLSSGRCAVLHFKGPYAGLQGAYDHLFGNWLPGSGEEPAEAPCYEVYLNSPMEVAPAELLTDVYLPLRAAT